MSEILEKVFLSVSGDQFKHAIKSRELTDQNEVLDQMSNILNTRKSFILTNIIIKLKYKRENKNSI